MRNIVSYLFIGLIFVLYSCNGEKNNTTNNSENLKPVLGGSLNLTLGSYPTSFFSTNAIDESSVEIISQIQECLVTYSSKTLEIVPLLAESWEIDDSKKEYTFHLKKGVKFHNDPVFNNASRELTSADVVATFYKMCTYGENNLIFDGSIKGLIKGADAYYEATKNNEKPDLTIEGIKVIDDYTVQISLNYSNSNFIQILGMPAFSILPEKCLKKYDSDFTVGTGPFILEKKNNRSEKILLIKNNEYHLKDSNEITLPYLDTVTYIISGQKNIELAEFKKGNIDLVWGLPSKNVTEIVSEQIGNFKRDSVYTVERVPEYSTSYISFNTKADVFNNVKIRQAFNYAIDKTKIVDDVLHGEAYSIGEFGIVPPAMAGYNVSQIKGYEFNVTEAKKLLAEAGYPNGKNFPEIEIIGNGDNKKNVSIIVEIQKQLIRNLGINVGLQIVSLNEKLAMERNGKGTLFNSGWTADYPDPSDFLKLFYGKSVPSDNSLPSHPNTSRFQNAEFDLKFEQAMQETNESKRLELLLEAEQILIDNAPIIPLYYGENYVLLRSYVKGFDYNALRYQNLKSVFIKK